MADTDIKNIATNVVKGTNQPSGTSQSESLNRSPVSDNVGQYSQKGTQFINRLEGMANSGKYNVDTNFINQSRLQILRGQSAKKVAATKFAGSLGDMKNRMAQAEFERRQKMAQGGFVGQTALAAQTKAAQTPFKNTIGEAETGYLNQLSDINSQVGAARQSEMDALKPLQARGFAQEAARNGLVGLKSDEGIIGKFGGSFGIGTQDSIGTLDEDTFKNNEGIQNLANELGININSGNFIQQVQEQVGQIVTGTAASVYDMTTDVYMDLGNGPQKVGEQTKSMAKAIMDDIFGTLNVGALGAIVITGGLSMAGSIAAEASASVSGAAAVGMEAGAATLTADTLAMGITDASLAAGMTEAEFASGLISSGMGEAIAGNEAALAAVGGEAGMGEAINSIQQTVESTIAEQLGAEGMASQTIGSINTAANVATQTISKALAEGVALTDELIETSTINALGVLENGEVISSLAMGTAEATGVSEAGALESGLSGTGALEGDAAIAGEEGIANEASRNSIFQRGFNKVAKSGEEVAAQSEAEVQGFWKSLGDKAWNNKLTTAIKGTVKGAIKGATFPFKVAARGAMETWTSPAGKTLIIAAGTAALIETLTSSLERQGINDDEITREINLIIEQNSKGANNGKNT